MSKTAEQVKEDLKTKGIPLTQWAKDNGFPVSAVRAVIYGRNKGYFGQGHRIAVGLGMKGQPK